MTKKKFLITLVATCITASASVGAAGVLNYATVGEPPSLDQHVVTSDLATTIAHHIFEGLYAFNANYAPEPLLAERADVQDGGKTIVIHLRKGVKFHNGKEMTSEDVLASMKRWLSHGSRGGLLRDNLDGGADGVSAAGKYAIKLKFSQRFGPWKNLLAFTNGGPVIYPAEVASGATEKPIKPSQYIGTGPYKFNEWLPNRHLELVRFDDYVPAGGAPDGYAGKREARLDALRFIPTPDSGARVSGVRAGDYDYAESIPGDLFDELDRDSSVKTIIGGAPIFGLVFMNSRNGPLKNNFKLRQAIQAALNKEDALRISIGPEKLWRLNGSFLPEGSIWYSDAGIQSFSEGDMEKSKDMAKQAGYDGEPIKFMVSTNYPFHYDQAVVFTKQLAQAGFNIDLQVYDWATLIKKRAIPEEWDLFFTHHGFVPDPVLLTPLNDNYPGWWTTPEKAELKSAFVSSNDDKERQKIWGDIQALIYEQVPAMKTGDVFTYNIASAKVAGISSSTLIWPHFWGVSK